MRPPFRCLTPFEWHKFAANASRKLCNTVYNSQIKQHFRTVATDGPEFDHLSPAVYLAEHESDFSELDGLGNTLDRFERLFQELNDLLPST